MTSINGHYIRYKLYNGTVNEEITMRPPVTFLNQLRKNHNTDIIEIEVKPIVWGTTSIEVSDTNPGNVRYLKSNK